MATMDHYSPHGHAVGVGAPPTAQPKAPGAIADIDARVLIARQRLCNLAGHLEEQLDRLICAPVSEDPANGIGESLAPSAEIDRLRHDVYELGCQIDRLERAIFRVDQL